MRKKLLSALIAGLFATTPAFGQSSDDPIRVQGSVSIGGIYNNQSAQDTAKLSEYQDVHNGVLSNVFIRGRNSSTWFDGYGENFGRDDQYMFLRGGMYDVFKAGVYLNDIPHTFSSSALTPYNGVGSSVLVATFPNINPATWSAFDLGYQRRDAGGYFEWQKNSPWYFRADGNEVTFSGTKVGSAANGTSPGNGFVDLAIPVQYKTHNWGVEGGYQTTKATFALRWDYSQFENANHQVSWTNPYFGSNLLDTTYLPPDNTFNKITLTGNYRDLPWKSVISARYTYARTTSDVDLAQTALTSGPAYLPTMPNQSTFHGEHINQSLALAWTATPMTNVDTRVYYYWTKLANHDDSIQYGNAPAQPVDGSLGCGNLPNPPFLTGNCTNDLFSYKKNNVGFDVWWRFAKNQRLGFGYDYIDLDQNRADYDKMHQSKAWVEYKNTMLDTLTGRFKYQYIKRDATLNYSTDGVSPNDPNYLLAFTSAFDLQSSTTNQAKLMLDWAPLPLLGLSFEGTWSKQDFDDHTFGMANVKRQGYFLSGNWGDSSKFMLTAFGSWEESKYPSDHRYIGSTSSGPSPPPGFCPTTLPNCYAPDTAPNSSAYNWGSVTRDQTWIVGVGADWPAMQNLLIKASYLYVKNNGQATFSSQDASGNMVAGPAGFGNPLNIGNWDDSTQQSLNLKAIWAYNKNWSFTAGYAWEKYQHADIGTDGYQYNAPFPPSATSTSTSYLNGYDAFTNGHQNIFYATVTYAFDAPPLPPAKLAEPPRASTVAAAPAPPPAAPTPPAPAAPAASVQRITLDSRVLFDFDKAVLKPEGRDAIDSQVVGKLAQMQKLEVVLVTGHTDRIGTEQYNQKLSERRADAVRDYLVSKGVPRDKIETIGMGEKQPVVQCDQKSFKALIECLQPNRRVEIQAKGESAR